MNDESIVLKYKIDLWNHLTNSVNEKQNSMEKTSNAFAVIGVAISTINAVSSNATVMVKVFDALSIALPLIILVFLFWFSLNNRSIAIMQGYLAGLEDTINLQLEGRIYQVNSYFHNLFSKKYFPSNNYVSILYGLVIIVLSYLSFRNIYLKQLIPLVFLVLYLIIFVIFVWLLMIELNTNFKIRGIARAYFHYIAASSEIDKMDLKEFLKYKPNIEKMIRLFEIDCNSYK